MSNPDKNLFTRTEPEFTVADSEPADQTLDTSDMTRTADAAKKKKANMIKIGAIVAAVVVVFVGLELVLGGNDAPPPPKLVKVTPPPAPPVQEKAPEMPAPSPAEQAPAAPAPEVAAPAPTPMAEPVPAGGISLPPNPAKTDSAPTAIEPNKDIASLNIPNSSKDASPVAQPAIVPVATPSVEAPKVAKESNTPADTTQFVKQGEFNLLADRVTALENEMASLRQLDDRVKKLEEASGQTTSAVKPAVDKKVEKTNSTWVDGKPAKKAVKPVSKTTEPKVKNVVKRSDDDVTHKKAKASSGGVANQFQLVAIVQGRAWLKTGDGSTVTVQEGDVLPNGAKIVRVDARRDEVQTSEGTLR